MDGNQAVAYKRTLSRYIPASAVDRVFDFMNQHSVHLHITRTRTSKLGDYRWPQPRHPFEEISINGDMNPYRALEVLLHEMAHLNTHQFYGNGVQPHGHEWQHEYQKLMLAYLDCFPEDIQAIIRQLTNRIPLSRAVQHKLEVHLQHYNPDYDATQKVITLNDLQPGTTFRIARKPQMLFRAEEKRRTRWLCTDIKTGQSFLVTGNAEVIIQN